jgi:hypothetical protein
MSEFPRTMVSGVSMPRLITGSNWMLGHSHTSRAKDRFIKELFDTPKKVADLVSVFAKHGCNAFMSMADDFIWEAIQEVEQRTGVKMIWITTPHYMEPGNPDSWKAMVEYCHKIGATFCWPHQAVVDPLLDRVNQRLSPLLIQHLKDVRDAGLLPGLSTHTPEAIVYADSMEADVVSYVQPYNSSGFLCQVEVDWIQQVIRNAHHPVMTIKPLAAGRILPPVGLQFVWNTIRDCDMVTVGTLNAYEAEEVIEISLACIEGRKANVELQSTRSKKSLIVD